MDWILERGMTVMREMPGGGGREVQGVSHLEKRCNLEYLGNSPSCGAEERRPEGNRRP